MKRLHFFALNDNGPAKNTESVVKTNIIYFYVIANNGILYYMSRGRTLIYTIGILSSYEE